VPGVGIAPIIIVSKVWGYYMYIAEIERAGETTNTPGKA
jgi:hypothetical protein